MKKFLKKKIKNKYLLISLLSSIVVISTIFILQQVSPFGDNSLLRVDFYHQYGPMLAEFNNRIKTFKNLTYSFSLGFGIPFFRNYFNYLSSPINLIMVLFKQKHILTSYSFIIGIKSILACITCSYYIKSKFKTDNICMIGLSLLYAYSAYFTAYYWNIMWIDGLYVLPILTLGIERLINKNNGFIYTISLVYMLYTNYFIGYMLCIYSCIYFIAYLIIKTDRKSLNRIPNIVIKFINCSLISGLLLAFELIPMYEALKTTNATMGTMPTSQYYAFTFLEFLKNHVTGVNSTVFASGISNAPNISCGILGVALLIVFILNKKISLKRKIILPLILIFLLLSFYIAPLDYVWHALHVPNDLPYRYSFIYSFILIVICAYSLKNIEKSSLLSVIIAFIIAIALITYVLVSKYDNINNNMIIINYALISIYFLIYLILHFFPSYKKFACIVFLGTCMIECIVSINNNWTIDQNIDSYYSDYDDIKKINENIKKNENEKFYRTERIDGLTLNDASWYNYYGQETFSSMAYYDMTKLNSNLGIPGNQINSYYYKENTPIYNLIFDIKYVIGNINDKTRFELIDKQNVFSYYKFKYTVGLLYGVNDEINNWDDTYINPLEYQNDFIYYATNIKNILHRLKLNKKEVISNDENETIIKYEYNNEYENIYTYSNDYSINYIVVNGDAYYKDDVEIGDIAFKLNTHINSYSSYNEEHIINSISEDEYITIYVSYNTDSTSEVDVYTIDNKKFVDAYDYLKLNEIKILDFKEKYIKGTIDLKENKTIFTSIPYDKGWKVYNNNKRIECYKINNALLGFDLPKGNNTVILKYTPNNFDIGISVSITSLIFSISYILIKKKKTNLQD